LTIGTPFSIETRNQLMDTTTAGRLRDYFKARLSPAEAAQACFGGKH
jgi:hypothetical protein